MNRRPSKARVSPKRSSQHLLDVKIRARTARKRRNRRVGAFILLFCVSTLTLSGILLGGSRLLDKFFFRNEAYALQRIVVDAGETVRREEILERTGLREGQNIFTLDLAAIQRTLQEDPRVAEAIVERELPGTLRLRIMPRTPVARVAALDHGEALFCIASDGTVMPIEADSTGLLPLVEVDQKAPLALSERISDDGLKAALELIRLNDHDPASLLRIVSIDASRPWKIVVTDQNGARISFGSHDLPSQIERLNKLLAHCEETQRKLETVNLLAKRNTPVTFVMASSKADRKAAARGSARPKSSN